MPATLESPATASTEDQDLNIYVERVNFVEGSGGKRFRALFMTPGIVDYTDVGGGKELIRKPAIDENLQSLIGAPLTMGHIPTSITSFEDVSNGKVDKVGFDSDSGWHFAEGPVETEQARQAIDKGWGISVGTRVKRRDFGPGGFWLRNKYDREIKGLTFHHLAIVDPSKQPRFEDAEISRINSTSKTPAMIKWIKKLVGADGKATEQVTDLSPAQRIDLGDGKSAALSEVLEVSRNNAVHALGADDYIEHDGIRYNCGECVKAYREKTQKMPGGHHPEERPNSTAAEAGLADPKTAKDALPGKQPESKPVEGAPAADQPGKTAAELETERLNAVNAEAEKTRLAEAAAAKKVADDLKLARAEEERLNAARKSGVESFTLLGTARENAPPVVAQPMTGTLAAKRARGTKLFGS